MLRDFYFARALRGTSRRAAMLGAHACAGAPLDPRRHAYVIPPLAAGGDVFVTDAPLPMSERPIMCAWVGFDHAIDGANTKASARANLRTFLHTGTSAASAWARANCNVTFRTTYNAGDKGAYFTTMSRAVFYLNPEGNTRALDNIRWGEIVRHASIPINVDTGEHTAGNRSSTCQQ